MNGKANTSHGNHVPTTQTASNKVFLRNDNTWQTITPANIGAAASSHTHSYAASSHSHAAGTITAGTLIAGVVATNSTDYTTYRLRNIAANTTALTANSSTLTNGTIYLQYE